jgi:hypothetical protein
MHFQRSTALGRRRTGQSQLTAATGHWSTAVNGLPSIYDCSGVLACFGSSATASSPSHVWLFGTDDTTGEP